MEPRRGLSGRLDDVEWLGKPADSPGGVSHAQLRVTERWLVAGTRGRAVREGSLRAGAEQCRSLGKKTNPRLQKQADDLVAACWALAAPFRSVTLRTRGGKPLGNLAGWKKIVERDASFDKNSRGEMVGVKEKQTSYWRERTVPAKDLVRGPVEIGSL